MLKTIYKIEISFFIRLQTYWGTYIYIVWNMLKQFLKTYFINQEVY